MGNLNKTPWWALLNKSMMRYPDLLIEVKFHVVSHHFPNDSDELAGTVSKGIIVSPAFGHLGFVVSLEGGIVFNNIVICINKCLSEDFRSPFGHSGFLSLKVP